MPRMEDPAGQSKTLLVSAEPQTVWAGRCKLILTFTARQTRTGHDITFFHPDCTVGLGIAPGHALSRSWAIPPVGTCTLPRRFDVQLLRL
jgi:hypothetical protein